MAQWLLLVLLIALGLGGYWLMGRVDGFLAGNLARGAGAQRGNADWTFETLCLIMGKNRSKGGRAHGSGTSTAGSTGAADAPHGCAG